MIRGPHPFFAENANQSFFNHLRVRPTWGLRFDKSFDANEIGILPVKGEGGVSGQRPGPRKSYAIAMKRNLLQSLLPISAPR